MTAIVSKAGVYAIYFALQPVWPELKLSPARRYVCTVAFNPSRSTGHTVFLFFIRLIVPPVCVAGTTRGYRLGAPGVHVSSL